MMPHAMMSRRVGVPPPPPLCMLSVRGIGTGIGGTGAKTCLARQLPVAAVDAKVVIYQGS